MTLGFRNVYGLPLASALCFGACGGSGGDDAPGDTNAAGAPGTGGAAGGSGASIGDGGATSGTGGADASDAGSPGSTGEGGTAPATGGTASGNSGDEPAWFAECDIGEITGSCDISDIDATGDACLEMPVGNLGVENVCDPDNIRDARRCDYEGAVAVCVTNVAVLSRNIYYVEPSDILPDFCERYCSPDGAGGSGGTVVPKGAPCAIAPGAVLQLNSACLCIDDGDPGDTDGYCGTPCESDDDCAGTVEPSRCLLQCTDNQARRNIVGNCLVEPMYEATVTACGD